ncbi:MMPL family transporter [Arthrobacter sp. JSM 101049]|uniref:MMPL family transporter n=1 Tax=Arthrobacter sp. JSM 101049 TaxID=929097 RepID=UPI00356610BD
MKLFGHGTKSEAEPRHRGVRLLVCAVLLLVWLGVAGIGGPTFGKLDQVQSNDQATFLPASAEATRALDWQQRFDGSGAIPAVVVLEAPDASALEGVDLKSLAADVADLDVVRGDVAGPFPSEDGLAVEMIVPLDADVDTDQAVDALRSLLDAGVPAGVTPYVAGPAGLTADLIGAFAGIDGILLLAALGAVLVILLLVYRSLLLPLAVLLTAMSALCAAILAVFWMAKAGWIALDGQSQGILSILVIGAATDYSLLLVARHKEAVADGAGRLAAVGAALRGAAAPIIASAATVTAGLLCLVFSDLNSNKALGPIGASGIVFSVLAALTLLPALLGLLGRASYWPLVPRHHDHVPDSPVEGAGIWGRTARLVRRHPRRIWITTAVVLLAGCAGVSQLQATGVPQSELVLGQTESAAGQDALARHFDAGAGSPATLITAAEAGEDMLQRVQDVDGVASAYLQAPGGAPAGVGAPGAETRPQVVDGRVLLSVTLSDPADSTAAQQTVVDLRQAAHAVDPEALVGGPSAVALDTNLTAEADLVKIIPLVLGAILVILVLLLRSILAPVLLVLTTVVSYGTAMGVSALVFNGVFGFPGADPSVPLFGFVFLVALGVDYNIFLMTRVREESMVHGTREGVVRGLAVTGGVISSAGIVLAATFAALGVIPIMFLVQLAFIVSFGVLLDTLVVRSLLVPALAYDLGERIWWPWRLRTVPADGAGLQSSPQGRDAAQP